MAPHPKPNWVEVRVVVAIAEADLAASLLIQEGARGVVMEEKGEEVELVSAFLETEDVPAKTGRIQRALDLLASELRWRPARLSSNPLQDVDWSQRAREAFKSFSVADRLLVCPSWDRPKGPNVLKEIVIDPGLAFGTGLHATTRMCLERLCEEVREGSSVWDLGCGTGILAIAARRLGASRVRATDSDPQAVWACEQNLEKNTMVSEIEVLELDGMPGPGEPWEVIVSNVTLDFLTAHARSILDRLAAQGRWILSGYLLTQEPELRSHLDALPFKQVHYGRQGEWGSAVAQRS